MFNTLTGIALLARMKRNQWKTTAELEEVQEEKLRALLSHSVGAVPYYRKNFAGLRAASLEDLSSLPITEKQAVKSHGDSFISERHKKASLSALPTSGSTGMPLVSYYDNRDALHGIVLRYHIFTECGFGPLDLLLGLTNNPPSRIALQRFIYRVGNIPPLRDETGTLSELKKLAPDMVFAYPSTMVTLAHRNNGLRNPVSLRTTISASELLTPSSRAAIKSSFGCDVRNYYGLNESWGLAWECERGSMHINSDSVIMEIVDEQGNQARKGDYGDVVLTSLWRYSMPFIRYRVGDRAALGSKCRCGRGLHVLKSIEGRTNDILFTRSMGRCSPMLVTMTLRHFQEILQYQVIQEAPGSLLVKIIPVHTLSKSAKEKIAARLNAVFPEKMDVEIEELQSIPRGRTGKHRCIISKVKTDEPI